MTNISHLRFLEIVKILDKNKDLNQFLKIFRSKMTLDNVLLEPTLNTVKGLMIMDNNGVRILSKYYDPEIFPTVAAQKKFEKTLFQVSSLQSEVLVIIAAHLLQKTHKANAEIIMLDGLTCLYKSSVDLFFYVVGSGQENELLLMAVLDCLFTTVSGILRKNVDKKSLCDNMEVIMLAMDEMIDNGMIMESDPQQVRGEERGGAGIDC